MNQGRRLEGVVSALLPQRVGRHSAQLVVDLGEEVTYGGGWGRGLPRVVHRCRGGVLCAERKPIHKVARNRFAILFGSVLNSAVRGVEKFLRQCKQGKFESG
jgi:hypothetical protein